jgi:hypothetical protein
MLPAALTVRRFSPELAPLLIAAAMPVLRPNPHSEAFLRGHLTNRQFLPCTLQCDV